MNYEQRSAEASAYHAAGLRRVASDSTPTGQKYPCGCRVKIAEALGPSMSHFPSGVMATVCYVYAHAYGGRDVRSYCLDVDGHGRCSWYNEHQLSLPNVSVRGGGTPYPASSVGDSCDACDSQEGRHYCLLYSRQMKNMDTLRCDDWTQRDDANTEITGESPAPVVRCRHCGEEIYHEQGQFWVHLNRSMFCSLSSAEPVDDGANKEICRDSRQD